MVAGPPNAKGHRGRGTRRWGKKERVLSLARDRVGIKPLYFGWTRSGFAFRSELERLLRDAVGCRMIADVPLGALLSGGVDSSAMVALMQAQSPRPVRTYSIGFAESDYDEARHANAVAAHLGTEHTELYVSSEEALAVVSRLPWMYDEPFADSSEIPIFLVSRMTRQHVTVALSGDGGDELFAGYNRHFWVQRLWRRFDKIPLTARRGLARFIRTGSPRFWDGAFGLIGGALPRKLRVSHPGHKVHRLADVLCERGPEETYRRLVSLWTDPASLVADAHEPPTLFEGRRTPHRERRGDSVRISHVRSACPLEFRLGWL